MMFLDLCSYFETIWPVVVDIVWSIEMSQSEIQICSNVVKFSNLKPLFKMHTISSTKICKTFGGQVIFWGGRTRAYILKAKKFAESAFQSQKNLRKKCVNLDINFLRQKCVNQ